MEINSISPDGRYKLETDSMEFRMSHWVDRPRLTDLSSGEVILDLGGTDWDVMNYKWKEDGVLWMELRKYPGDRGSVAIHLRLTNRVVSSSGWRCKMNEIEKCLNRIYRTQPKG